METTVQNIGDYFSKTIVDSLSVGVVVLDLSSRVVVWNSFMSKHSGIGAEDAVGKDLFDIFPYLSRNWLELKFQSLRILKSYSFVSWKQRPYLFRFQHNRQITGGGEYMYQDCTFIPILDTDGKTTLICMTIQDMTEAAESQKIVEEVIDANKALQLMTNYDALTSVYNRGYIEKQLEAEFNKSKMNGNVFSMLMFDLDHFKKVNDTYGHLAGDDVLKTVSKKVGGLLRNAVDSLGRYGGEEFIIILTETNEETAAVIAEQIREGVEQMTISSGDYTIKATLSMGVVEYRADLRDYLQMLHEVDIALYNSKKQGRNRVTKYTQLNNIN
ncbi:diguanylate cyclase [Candidatus Magnetominusculus xianensis]|uniref:diguanylate cyclase n=1 Tax=Candidatus Magnetominusculus xianensis TaxID=1748249 RepID=A0ABR5SF77_9BACT|nr:diguanylate cyclase [Candidatus Magnetominusculus xianensis]KWT85541.1 diguanylate cyclase [Candidatus Magnetominusculus xianensis]MBF0404228.1 diguanylate cyclase [Nitrospirota bacterium]